MNTGDFFFGGSANNLVLTFSAVGVHVGTSQRGAFCWRCAFPAANEAVESVQGAARNAEMTGWKSQYFLSNLFKVVDEAPYYVDMISTCISMYPL